MTSDASDAVHAWPEGSVPVEELARRQGVQPIRSVDDLARDDVFESDGEVDEFLAFISTLRHSDAV